MLYIKSVLETTIDIWFEIEKNTNKKLNTQRVDFYLKNTKSVPTLFFHKFFLVYTYEYKNNISDRYRYYKL